MIKILRNLQRLAVKFRSHAQLYFVNFFQCLYGRKLLLCTDYKLLISFFELKKGIPVSFCKPAAVLGLHFVCILLRIHKFKRLELIIQYDHGLPVRISITLSNKQPSRFFNFSKKVCQVLYNTVKFDIKNKQGFQKLVKIDVGSFLQTHPDIQKVLKNKLFYLK